MPYLHQPTRLIRDERGSVAMIFALTSTVALAIGGVSYEYGRSLYTRSKMQSALDAAVLAAAVRYCQNGHDMQDAQGVARNMFEAKFAGSSEASQQTTGPTPDGPPKLTFLPSNNDTIAAEAVAKITTPLIGLVSHGEVEIGTSAAAKCSKRPLDLGIMVDITGSMGEPDNTIPASEGGDGTKLGALRVAGQDFINRLLPHGDVEGVRVSIAPFSQRVWLDRPLAQLVTGQPLTRQCRNWRRRTQWTWSCTNSNWSTRSSCYTIVTTCDGSTPSGTVVADGGLHTRYLSGCMKERANRNTTDQAPAPGHFQAIYTTSATDSCVTPSKLLPLTSSKSTLVSKFQSFTVPAGGTAGHLGTAWAWYSISPEFSSVFTGTSTPAPYLPESDPNATIKALILMTDGDYTYYNDWPSGCNGSGFCQPARQDARALCEAAKARGVQVFAIGFGLAGSQNQLTPAQIAALPEHDGRKVLADCAGPGRYYFPYDGAAMREAFRDIGAMLVNRAFGAVLVN